MEICSLKPQFSGFFIIVFKHSIPMEMIISGRMFFLPKKSVDGSWIVFIT